MTRGKKEAHTNTPIFTEVVYRENPACGETHPAVIKVINLSL